MIIACLVFPRHSVSSLSRVIYTEDKEEQNSTVVEAGGSSVLHAYSANSASTATSIHKHNMHISLPTSEVSKKNEGYRN